MHGRAKDFLRRLDKLIVPDPQLCGFYSNLYPVYLTLKGTTTSARAHLGRPRQEYGA
jgi:hypothetical protein